MKLYLLTIVLILTISCNETTKVTDNSSPDFLPLKVGNYWIFKHYETNSYNDIIDGTQTEDSLVIIGNKNINNQTVSILIKYRENLPIDTTYLYKDKNVIYRFYDSTKVPIPHLKSQWLPIIDYNILKNHSWNIFNTTINKYPYNLDDSLYYTTYQHTINGTYVSNDSITFGGNRFLSKKYSDKYDSRLTFQIKKRVDDGNGNYHYDSLDYVRTMKYFDDYHLIENIGFYKISRLPYTLYINTTPSSNYDKTENFNGFVSELERYYISQ